MRFAPLQNRRAKRSYRELGQSSAPTRPARHHPELVPDEPAAAARQDRRVSRATCPAFRLQLAGSHLTQRLVGKILRASSASRGTRRDTDGRNRNRGEMGSEKNRGGGLPRT